MLLSKVAEWWLHPCRREYQKPQQKRAFSGLDSMTLDMGDYNQGIGLHGMKISIQCEHFNPFRILPNLESEEYGDGVTSNRSYTEICNEWFATFTDPVLRTWAALVQNKKELPKDLLVNGAVAFRPKMTLMKII